LPRRQRDRPSSVPRSRRVAPGARGYLTKRTRAEGLRLLTQGLADREIAQRLFVSPRTVQHHLARVREKTDTRRRSELARWAVIHSVG
jgi:DNA-binding CsgD family transcriptional regulator